MIGNNLLPEIFGQRSIWNFALTKFRYYQSCRFDPTLTEHNEILTRLQNDGIVIQEGFFSKSQVQSILDEIEQAKQSPDRVEVERSYTDSGIYRIYNVLDLAPNTGLIADSPIVNSVFKAYFSSDVKRTKFFYEEKSEIGAESVSNLHHFDDWKHRVKAFLYLTDVTKENAPLLYVKGSNKQGIWRLWKEYEYFQFRNKTGNMSKLIDYTGSFLPHEVEILKRRHPFEEILCTGKAGTVILMDARGLHSSTVLEKGERRLLVGYWT